ncbi:MAG TPA: YidC/Oxa1 family membrane protein insertase [Candidatus Limnocylindrales bacterium]|nr:YidC/Oxa1 family membrane protein insertase [Candidatus Limnocylindrales bacterium]
MTRIQAARPWLLPLLALLGIALVVAACGGGAPGGSGAPGQSPTPNPAAVPLHPAQPTDPLNLFAWLFTPIFQALFIVLAASYVALHSAGVPGAIGIAIIALTLVVRTLLIPLFRRQLVSQRRMQMLQPELAEAKRRYKGDRMKAQQAQQEIMRERGVNPVSGCLPILLQLPLLFIIYSVIQNGITNFNPTQMLQIAGIQIVPLMCPTAPIFDAPNHVRPCIDPIVPWLGGLNVSVPEVFIGTAGNFLSGLGILSIVSAILQLIQSRMMLTPADPNNDDPNLRVQRQMMLFLPLISIAWGSILPAGLFIYWIVATLFSIVQQYLIVGWGAMFPLFGWRPAFATNHTPRFPVSLPPPDPTKRSPTSPSRDSTNRATSANKTIRPRERGRQGRRGRRR